MFKAPSSIYLPVPHLRQQDSGECLAACVAMVLNYLKFKTSYRKLIHVLQIERGIGTRFSNINQLDRLGVRVLYQENGTLQQIYGLLDAGWPVIAAVQTSELPYWNGVLSQHVVVVTGMKEQSIYLNDPDLAYGGVEVLLGDFDLAWFEQEQSFAVLSL